MKRIFAFAALILLFSQEAEARRPRALRGGFGARAPLVTFTNTKSTKFIRTSSQYATCGDVATGGGNHVTWSIWLKPSAWPVTTPADYLNKCADTDWEWFLRIKENVNGTLLTLIPATATDGGKSWTSAANALTLNVWNHIVVVYDGTQGTNAGRLKHYVNGTDITAGGSFAGTIPATLRNNAQAMRMGAFAGTAQNFYGSGAGGGLMDEVAIWVNKSLSSTEVTELYNSGASKKLDSLTFASPTHWWRMGDGDTSPTISDNIDAIHCTMVNTPTFVSDGP